MAEPITVNADSPSAQRILEAMGASHSDGEIRKRLAEAVAEEWNLTAKKPRAVASST